MVEDAHLFSLGVASLACSRLSSQYKYGIATKAVSGHSHLALVRQVTAAAFTYGLGMELPQG